MPVTACQGKRDERQHWAFVGCLANDNKIPTGLCKDTIGLHALFMDSSATDPITSTMLCSPGSVSLHHWPL